MSWPPGGGGQSARGLRGRGGARRRWRKVLVAAREAVAAAVRSQHDQVSPPSGPGPPRPCVFPILRAGLARSPAPAPPRLPAELHTPASPEPGAPAAERAQFALLSLLGQRSSPARFASRWKPPTGERSSARRGFGCVYGCDPPLPPGWAQEWGNGGAAGHPDPTRDPATACMLHRSSVAVVPVLRRAG